MDERLIHAQVKLQIRRRALAFLARATGFRDPELPDGVPDFTYAAHGMFGYHDPSGAIALWGTADPKARELLRAAMTAAYARHTQRERHSRAHTILTLPYPAMRALVLAYVDLCRHDSLEAPWPRGATKLAIRMSVEQCRQGHDAAQLKPLQRALINATQQQHLQARAIALEAWFPGIHDGKKAT